MSVVIDVYQFGQEFFIIGIFLEIFVQIPKKHFLLAEHTKNYMQPK